MLKNILIPEKIGNYYLFKQKVVGLELNKTKVNNVVLSISGKQNVKIESYNQEALDRLNLSSFNNADYIKVSLPSYLVIFKELTFPFVDLNKIRSILNFEIEPIIPFSINDAVIDFITTKVNKTTKESTIMVAIARKKDVSDLLQNFKNQSINITNVVVDIFNLFGLYKTTHDTNRTQLFIDMHLGYTNFAYIQEGQLKLIRSLQYGFDNLISDIAKETNYNETKIVNYLNLHNETDESINEAFSKVTNNFASTVAFTINSFKTILPNFSPIDNFVLTNYSAQIKNLNDELLNNLNLPSHTITANSLIKDKDLNLPSDFTQALANAYPTPLTEDFNLLKQEFDNNSQKMLKNQVLTFLILLSSIFIVFLGYSYYQKNKLKNEIANSKKQVTNALNDTFNINDKSILKNLSETINTANNKLNEEEAIWFSFSKKNRFSFLKYINELGKILNDPAIGLNLHSLSILHGIITIEGQVENFEQLSLLEKKLNESNLFSHITIPQETRFTIKLTIRKNEELV